MYNSLFISLHVQSRWYFLSHSQEGRKWRKTGTKKTTAVMQEKKLSYRGSVDFIQSIMPLILISNRSLDSRRTNGLITDATRTNGWCGNMCADLLAFYNSTLFLFPSSLLSAFEITNNTIITEEEMKDLYAISSQKLKRNWSKKFLISKSKTKALKR